MARYATEMRERALRMLGEARVGHPNQMTSTIRHVAGLLGMSPETLRVWQATAADQYFWRDQALERRGTHFR